MNYSKSKEEFEALLVSKQLPISFNDRLFGALRHLILNQALDTSKLNLDHEIFTYNLSTDTEMYHQLVHFRTLLKKKSGVLAFEYFSNLHKILVLGPKMYFLSFYNDKSRCKCKGVKLNDNTMNSLEDKFLKLIIDHSTYKSLQLAYSQFKIKDSKVFFESLKKNCASNSVTKVYQVCDCTLPFGYYYNSLLRTSTDCLNSILDSICHDDD